MMMDTLLCYLFWGCGEEIVSHAIFLQDSILIISGQSSSSNFPVYRECLSKKLKGTHDAFIVYFWLFHLLPPRRYISAIRYT